MILFLQKYHEVHVLKLVFQSVIHWDIKRARDGFTSEARSTITKLTKQFPLSVWNEPADISSSSLVFEHEVDLEPVVGPTPELHLAVLVVEGEPGDVYGAGGLEDPGRDVGAETRAGHHYVGLVGWVKALAGAEHFEI